MTLFKRPSLSCALLVLITTLMACQQSVRVVEVKGKAIQTGKFLAQGDVLTSQEVAVLRGRLVVSIEEVGSVRVYPNSRMRVDMIGNLTSLSLMKGMLWVILPDALGDKKFEVKTSNAVLNVRGTEFIVEKVQKDDTEIRVVRGQVEVRNPAAPKKIRSVRGAQRSRIRGRKPPSPPKAYDPTQDRDLWRQLEEVLNEIIDLATEAGKAIGESVKEVAPKIQRSVQKEGYKLQKRLEELLDD